MANWALPRELLLAVGTHFARLKIFILYSVIIPGSLRLKPTIGRQVVVAVVEGGFTAADLPAGTALETADFVLNGVPGGSSPHALAVARTILRHAPKALLVSIRVLDSAEEAASRQGTAAAFRWLANARERLGLTLVCATIGDNLLHRADWSMQGCAASNAIRDLVSSGVTVVVPARNHDGQAGEGMMWPAILREVTSVAACDEAGATLPNSCRLASTVDGGCGCTTAASPEAGRNLRRSGSTRGPDCFRHCQRPVQRAETDLMRPHHEKTWRLG